MVGKYRHTVDAKGRLFVPAKLREELGDEFYVTIGLDHCLSVYTLESWQDIMARYNALPLSKARKIRLLFANATKCEPDKQGRFLLPADLRRFAGIDQDVMFLGQGNHAEIWNAAEYDELEQTAMDAGGIAAEMEELEF